MSTKFGQLQLNLPEQQKLRGEDQFLFPRSAWERECMRTYLRASCGRSCGVFGLYLYFRALRKSGDTTAASANAKTASDGAVPKLGSKKNFRTGPNFCGDDRVEGTTGRGGNASAGLFENDDRRKKATWSLANHARRSRVPHASSVCQEDSASLRTDGKNGRDTCQRYRKLGNVFGTNVGSNGTITGLSS